MISAAERATKLERVREWLAATGREAALFATPAWFAWLTGGGRGGTAMDGNGSGSGILVTPDRAILIADRGERQRLDEELTKSPFEHLEFSWWSASLADAVLRVIPGERLMADVPLPGAGAISAEEALHLRNPLLPSEVERYRALGRDVGVALTHAGFHCRPGLSENQLAGLAGKVLLDFGITPTELLAAADERALTQRHPLPTNRCLEQYAVLRVTANRHGLHLSATRLIHFGPVPETLRRRHLACARVEAALLAVTRPGTPLADLFHIAQSAYAAEGYPDEWQAQPPGGPTGYAARDLHVTSASRGAVLHLQAFAWSPTLSGARSEDTVLATDAGIEMLAATPDLPTLEIEIAGQRFSRPAILER